MKKNLLTALFTGILCITSLASCQGNKDDEFVAIIKFGTHTSLDEIETAITTQFDKFGKIAYKTYDCSFSSDLITQTITGLKNKKVKGIIPIATPVAQVAAANYTDIPIVFAAVSDPIGAGIVTNLEAPTTNVTGASDEIQVSSLVDKAIEIDSDISKIGFIYNPAEANSVTNYGKLQTYCSSKNIEVIAKSINNSSEMTEIANSLVSKVDAILVTDDNTVASGMTALANITRSAKIPCYTGADSMIKDGGMLCVGINYTTLGTFAAEQMISILNGKKVSEVPVKVFNENLNIYLNTDYIKETGIVIPDAILNDPSLIKVVDSND